MRHLRVLLLTSFLISVQGAMGATLNVYISEPDAQATTITGASTANFNGLGTGLDTSTYHSPIGNFLFSNTTPVEVIAADQFGGASGSRYISLGAQSGTSAAVTVNLTASVNYLGIWWSAADTNNQLSVYSGTTLIKTLTTADILSLLGGSTVTAVNGSVYNTSQYFGNPNNNLDPAEPFYYLELVTTGVTFDKLVMSNSGSTGTGFESDNWSTFAGTVSVPTTDVLVDSFTVVPEPSQYAAMFGAVIFCLVTGHRLLKPRHSQMA